LNFYDNFTNKHLKIAHRGYRSIRAENTLSAFEQSISKFDFIELDIQVTKDYELVVFHDYKLERTTDINKNNRFLFNGSYNIYDYTFDELRLLDIGSWFIKDDPFGAIKDGLVKKEELENLEIQKLLTLEDILIFVEKKNIALNIELKDCSYIDDEKFVLKVNNTIKKLNITTPLLISSFNHNYLKLFKQHNSKIETAANVENKHPKNLIDYLKNLEVSACHICSNLVDSTPIKELNSQGIVTSVFTVNDKKKQKLYYEKGVKAIFTDIL